MAWICSAASGALALRYPNGSPLSPIAKSTDMPKVFYCHGCATGQLVQRPYGTTCEHSSVISSNKTLTLFIVGSLVRTLALRALALAWKVSEADFFSRSYGLSKSASPPSSSLKTSRPLGPVGVKEWGKSWPNVGMIADGQLYQLRKLERPTSETVGSYLPTPTASPYGSSANGCPGDGRTEYATKGKMSLETMARKNIWPTPTASMITMSDMEGQRYAGRDQTRPSFKGNGGGTLNPTWVEWLMGFPIEWTELGDLETQWFRSKRGKHLKS